MTTISARGEAQPPASYQAMLQNLVADIRMTQVAARSAQNVARNYAYWLIGRTAADLSAAASYGDKVIDRLVADLRREFPEMTGARRTNVDYMRRFAETWPEIAQQPLGDSTPAVARLPWGHVTLLLDKFRSDRETGDWYAAQAVANGWSRAVLGHEIAGAVHLRVGQALNNFQATLPPVDSDLAVELSKDPYLLDFVETAARASERDLEQALVRELVRFMTELGNGFLWAGRQRRLALVDEDSGATKEFFLDLLFYHHTLRRWIVIELKTGEFENTHAQQVALYCRLVDEQLRHQDDGATIGLVLCPSRHRKLVQYTLESLTTPVAVATYTYGQLPDEVRAALPSPEQLQILVDEVASTRT